MLSGTRMNADTIIEALDTLTLAELRRVDTAVHQLIDTITEWQRRPDEQPLDEQTLKGKTYRLEKVRCGKETCKKCEQGPGHGPYWYAYWSVNGRTRKQYIGKELKEV